MFNASAEAVDFYLPPRPNGARWHLAVDTCRDAPHTVFAAGEELRVEHSQAYHLSARSSAILVAHPSNNPGRGFEKEGVP